MIVGGQLASLCCKFVFFSWIPNTTSALNRGNPIIGLKFYNNNISRSITFTHTGHVTKKSHTRKLKFNIDG